MKAGDRVNRIEDRAVTGAVVVAIEDDAALLKYDEGGEGWWPISALQPDEAQP